MIDYVYLAKIEWGTPRLTRFEVKNETEKSFVVSWESVTNSIGDSMYANRIDKRDKDQCATRDIHAALHWLEERQKMVIFNNEQKLQQSKLNLEEISHMLRDISEAKEYGANQD